MDIPKKRNRVYRIFSRHFSYKMRGRFNFKWQIKGLIMPIRTFKKKYRDKYSTICENVANTMSIVAPRCQTI